MNKKIISALSSLNIPIAFLEYHGNATAYVIFKVYNEADADFEDDVNTAELNYITLSYWYKNPVDKDKAKEIKRLMKQAGFIFDGGADLISENAYGKSLDFIYKEYL